MQRDSSLFTFRSSLAFGRVWFLLLLAALLQLSCGAEFEQALVGDEAEELDFVDEVEVDEVDEVDARDIGTDSVSSCSVDTDCPGHREQCCGCTAVCLEGVCVSSCFESACCAFKACGPQCELLRPACRLDQHCPELLPFCTDGLCSECAAHRDCDDSASPSCEQGMCRPLDCSLMSCPSFAPVCIGGLCHLDTCGPDDPCISARATCEQGICRLDDYDVLGLSCHFQVSSQGWVSLGEDWSAMAPMYSSDGEALLLPVWY
ncbi:MAG: hypothetical protein RBU37_14635 [Myxococcota bacterium]|jgi:hypothetical protein|nr:hypothetical protein [Myxococcota bacterium]